MYEIVKQVLEVQAPFNMVIVVVFIGAVGGVIGTISKEIRKFATHRSDLEMKREMLDRGLGVEEIDQVLRAGDGRSKKG